MFEYINTYCTFAIQLTIKTMETLLIYTCITILSIAFYNHVDANNKEAKAKKAKKENRIIYLK